MTTRKKLGLALGSGAARGLAHIGVLKVLDEEGIPIDFIAGTSIGAFIGALYAAGVPVRQMEEVAGSVDWQSLARLVDPIIPTSGIIDGRRVTRFMSELLPVGNFEDLRIPLGVVATDLESGEAVIIRRGNLTAALRAAVSFPGIFTPVPFGKRFLIDGGLVDPVPVDVAREMGAEIAIGVCAIPEVEKRPAEDSLPAQGKKEAAPGRFFDFFTSPGLEKKFRELWRPGSKGEVERAEDIPRARKPPGMLRIFAQCVAIMENRINSLQLERSETGLLIRPDLNGITLLEFHRAQEAIRAGEEATRPLVKTIRRLADL